ncbi:protein RCC2 homolog [Diadema antillarum]|uniref:protein RCC2 homolog n=1 Tax=Diadema antillarum TaxID=105358 RepID=UPI003A87C42B
MGSSSGLDLFACTLCRKSVHVNPAPAFSEAGAPPGGLVLGCLFGQKDSLLELSSWKDVSPSRYLCLCEDRLFCINRHDDCYVLELSDATGARPKKVSVYNEVRTAGRDSLHSQSHRIADEEGIAAVGQVALGVGSSTPPAVPCSEHDLSQTSDKKTGFRHLACGDSLVLCALDPDRQAGQIVRSEEDEFVVHRFSHPLSVRAISCGKEHGLLLVDQGLVYSLGLGSRGQLGHGDTDSEREPRLIEALGCVGVTSVSAGGWHSACISDIGDLYIWGWNEAGQLGLSLKAGVEEEPGASSPRSDHSPSRVTFQMVPAILDFPGGVNVSKVSCGSRHTAAVTYDKRLYTWGWGKYGQLGHGDVDSQDQPKHVEFFHLERLWVTDVMCGDWTTVAQTCPAPSPMPP